jgi:hypothetical protein
MTSATNLHSARERFIPFVEPELVELLCAEEAAHEREQLRTFARVLQALYHFELHAKVESLKDAYFPFDPDLDVRTKRSFDTPALDEHEQRLVDTLTEVLRAANYEPVPKEALESALEHESLFHVSLAIDFGDFDRCVVFRRGDVTKEVEVKGFLPWKKKTLQVSTFERVVVLVKFQGEEYFAKRKRKDMAFKPGSVMVKLFKNVPKADLEMLFPNTQIRMRPRDLAMLVLPAVFGGLGVLVKAAAQLGAAIAIAWALTRATLEAGSPPQTGLRAEETAALVAAFAAIGSIAAFATKQWTRFTARKLTFFKLLGDNLYFKTLDSNAGVFHRLIDEAEQEECKEALLAYAFLRKHPAGLTERELDLAVEDWFRRVHGVEIDFEVDDALRKLTTLRLAEAVPEAGAPGPRWRVLPLHEACARLDAIWDGLFRFDTESASSTAA